LPTRIVEPRLRKLHSNTKEATDSLELSGHPIGKFKTNKILYMHALALYLLKLYFVFNVLWKLELTCLMEKYYGTATQCYGQK